MTTLSQKNFTGGELAPALHANTDLAKYKSGAKTIRNAVVMRHGGVTNRSGFRYIAQAGVSSTAVRLINFEFNSSQTYALEFGHQYMRVFLNGQQQVLTGVDISAITLTHVATITTGSAHGYTTGDEVYLNFVGSDRSELYGLNRNFRITVLTATTFTLNYLDGTAVNPIIDGITGAMTYAWTAYKVYQLSTPYGSTELSDLQFVQSADVITIVHPSYAPRELSRSGHTSWTLTSITFAPTISAPTLPAAVNGTAGTTEWIYKVTTVASETYEESLPTAGFYCIGGDPTAANPNAVTWTAASNALEYNVYREVTPGNGVYGYIGTARGTTFNDIKFSPDSSDTPPDTRNPFSGSSNYPSTVAYIQQRLTFGNTTNYPQKGWMSRSSQFKNFTISSPLQDDDAVTFNMVGRKVNSIRHFLDLGKPVVLTSTGEHTLEGDSAGIIKPTDINPKQQSYNGSASLAPVVIGGNAIYLQARQSTVRDLAFEFETSGYRGNDLSLFAAHLFDGYTIVSWAYQQNPHSVLWAVRSDGVLLGLTYIREQQVWGWHRHDTDGLVESVIVIPEGTEDVLYAVINRTIDGNTVRNIERLTDRFISDINDYVGMDSAFTFGSGIEEQAYTMTVSGGSTWGNGEILTLTASGSVFASSFVGQQIHIQSGEDIIRFDIVGYTSATVVTVNPNRTVPSAMRSTAISDWSFAYNYVRGLWHLEGETVSVFADGLVVASPNNDSYDTITVSNGEIELDAHYRQIHVGLPYISDLETLNIEAPQGETMVNKMKMVQEVTVSLEDSRGIWVGGAAPSDDDEDPLEGLTELIQRSSDESYDNPPELRSDPEKVLIRPEWNSNGRVFIRQVDPVPMSILAVAPSGFFPMRG